MTQIYRCRQLSKRKGSTGLPNDTNGEARDALALDSCSLKCCNIVEISIKYGRYVDDALLLFVCLQKICLIHDRRDFSRENLCTDSYVEVKILSRGQNYHFSPLRPSQKTNPHHVDKDTMFARSSNTPLLTVKHAC